MTSDAITGKINAVIADVLNADPNNVKPAARLREELACDDFDVIDLLGAVEDELHLEYGALDPDAVSTVADLHQAALDALDVKDGAA